MSNANEDQEYSFSWSEMVDYTEVLKAPDLATAKAAFMALVLAGALSRDQANDRTMNTEVFIYGPDGFQDDTWSTSDED